MHHIRIMYFFFPERVPSVLSFLWPLRAAIADGAIHFGGGPFALKEGGRTDSRVCHGSCRCCHGKSGDEAGQQKTLGLHIY